MSRFLVCSVLLAAALSSLFAGGCSTMPPQTGPMVAVRNDSDTPLRVRFWIGDRRQQAAGKPLEMTADKLLELPPYGTTQYKLSAFSAYESPTESFVRVQVEPVGPTFAAATQYWYELNPPSPFAIRISGRQPNLKFERSGPGTMAMVPPAYWFHANPAPGTTATANGSTVTSIVKPGQPTTRLPSTTTPATPPAGTATSAAPKTVTTSTTVVGVTPSSVGGRD